MEVEVGAVLGSKERVKVKTGLSHNHVKPSRWIPLGHPDFGALFDVVWTEHVDGFKKPKRERTDKEKAMVWRQRLAEKKRTAQEGENPRDVSDAREGAMAAYERLRARRTQPPTPQQARSVDQRKVGAGRALPHKPLVPQHAPTPRPVGAGEADNKGETGRGCDAKRKLSKAERKALKRKRETT